MPLLVEFAIDDQRYALPLAGVLEIALRVEIVPLAGTADPVVGLVRHRAEAAVAVDLRKRLGHPPRAPQLDDHLILARTSRRRVALIVDRVVGLRRVEEAAVTPPQAPSAHVRGVVVLDDGLLLLSDLEAVLSLDEEAAIDRALEEGAARDPALEHR